MLLEEKLVVTNQDTASKDTFFLINVIFQSNICLKISHLKMKNVTRGGVRKVPKKCHVLFEWPLITNKLYPSVTRLGNPMFGRLPTTRFHLVFQPNNLSTKSSTYIKKQFSSASPSTLDQGWAIIFVRGPHCPFTCDPRA